FKFIFSGVGKEIAEKIIELYKDEISSGNPFIVRQKDEEFEEINTFNGTYLVVKSGNQLLDLANGFEAKAQEISKMYDITGCCGRRFQLLVIDEEQYKLSLNIE
ncbi:MAG: hypothetical protein KDJ52_33105, partial [Anaerolineae bacterium]|nr:hypothetical protein [Anaerolineae bacterium]